MLLAACVVLLAASAVLSLAFSHGAVADKMHRALSRVPVVRFRRWLDGQRAPFAATDSGLAALGRAPFARLGALGALVAAWTVESFETWLLLHLLGADVRFAHAIAIEACVVLLRNAAFFVPSGLGVQDAGYLSFLDAVGAPPATGPAFVILKRAKELVWIAIGYLTLTQIGSR
jgi:uncharacterized membrane protein YbhN (UPF0104 family)